MFREILHVDINSFYVSVELREQPKLMKEAVAVGGDEKNRHGIILAKTPLAKKYGVKTGETIWEAKKKCPQLILLPPHYEKYLQVSRLAHNIYYSYTNQVEPYGMDECWLDITGSKKLFGSADQIAHKIKRQIKNELGVTVSVGLSFNKVFSKLASDLKKPDALTIIPPKDFKKIVWPLPIQEMIMVGSSTTQKLNRINIYTLGELANTDPAILKSLLGINGVKLWHWANGHDDSYVRDYFHSIPIESIGKSITCSADLENNEEVGKVIQKLCQDISKRLIENKFLARGIHIGYRDDAFLSFGYDALLPYPTYSSLELFYSAYDIFKKHHTWKQKVRTIYVRAIHLVPDRNIIQSNFLHKMTSHYRRLVLEKNIYHIRKRFGEEAITYANLMGALKMPSDNRDIVKMPPSFFIKK
ncbi:MAG: DNA polymerase IV [Tissierellia bacterium]|nr:DNA polymerase IV [Tissierellia bacterium]